jgi:hypothetical protein
MEPLCVMKGTQSNFKKGKEQTFLKERRSLGNNVKWQLDATR